MNRQDDMAISEPTHDSASQTPSDLHPQVDRSARPRKRGWLWFLILVALAGGGYFFYRSRVPAETKAAPTRGGRGASLGAVSVAVAPALKENIPYYLTGLG